MRSSLSAALLLAASLDAGAALAAGGTFDGLVSAGERVDDLKLVLCRVEGSGCPEVVRQELTEFVNDDIGPVALFSLQGIEDGAYVLWAWRDTNGNDAVDPSEPYGRYPGGIGQPAAIEPPLNYITITLSPYDPAAAER